MSDRSVLIHLAVAAFVMAIGALGVVAVDEAAAREGHTTVIHTASPAMPGSEG